MKILKKFINIKKKKLKFNYILNKIKIKTKLYL